MLPSLPNLDTLLPLFGVPIEDEHLEIASLINFCAAGESMRTLGLALPPLAGEGNGGF